MDYLPEYISTIDIFQIYNKIKKEINTEDFKSKIYNENTDVILKESTKIREYNKKIYNGNVDFSIVSDRLKKDFFNPSTSQIMSEITSMIFLSNSNKSVNYKLRFWLNNLKVKDDKNKKTIEASVKNSNDIFILKTPSLYNDFIEIIHDYFVARNLNKLREIDCLNFIYTYGIFSFSPLITNSKKDISLWSLSNDNVYYSVFENTNNKYYMDSTIENMDIKLYLNIYLQILYSIGLANRKIDFTHYDLSIYNVILRGLDEDYNEMLIPVYDTEKNGKKLFIKSKYIAVITNFGRSHINIDGFKYGTLNYLEFGVRNNPNIIHDVYKFLMSSMYEAYIKKNKELLSIGGKIFKFFNPNEPFINVLVEQKKVDFSLPYEDYFRMMKLNNLVKYIYDSFGEEIDFVFPEEIDIKSLNEEDDATSSPSIMSCYNLNVNVCELKENIEEDIEVKFGDINITFLDFYDSYFSVPDINKKIKIKENYRHNIRYGLELFYKDIKLKREDIITLGENIFCLDTSDLSIEDIYSYEVLEKYQEYTDNILKISNIIVDFNLLIDIGLEILSLYEFFDKKEKLKDISKGILDVRNKIRVCIESINEFYIKIKNIYEQEEAKEFINEKMKNDVRFEWYLEVLKNYIKPTEI